MEGICVVCNDLTKYTCLKCKVYVCNRGIKCSVPASEDYPGWKSGSSVALCDTCDKKETYATDCPLQKTDSEQSESDPNNAEPDDFNSEEVSTDVPLFSLACAARGFHEYRKIWAPTINQKLIVKPQTRNLFDPYAIGLFTKIRGKIEPLSLVGQLPREISRFSKFYLEYGGNMKASVRNVKFRRSPLPQGGLEIPITLTILQNNASLTVYNKMQEFMMEYYVEPENIPTEIVEDDNEDIFDF